MTFPVACKFLACRGEEKAGVIDAALCIKFRHTAAQKIHTCLTRQRAQMLPDFAAARLRTGPKPLQLIQTAEHFRQQNQLRTLPGASKNRTLRLPEILLHIRPNAMLGKSDTHVHRPSNSGCCLRRYSTTPPASSSSAG